MNDEERMVRTACVAKALAAFGEVSDETASAIVDLTSGIPFFVPPERGQPPTRELLFPAAVVQAALTVTYGRIKPGDILDAAIELAGTTRTDQGHTSQRRWVAAARRPERALPFSAEAMREVPAGLPVRAIGKGS